MSDSTSRLADAPRADVASSRRRSFWIGSSLAFATCMALCTFISLLILAFYYLPTPWDWVAFVFLVGAVLAVMGIATTIFE